MDNKAVVIDYLIEEYFDGDIQFASNCSGFSVDQISKWISGEVTPRKQSVNYLLHVALVPEFTIVAEFAEFDSSAKIRPQLKNIFKGHEDRSGIYAFYDSMANLLYLGKATNLLDECYSAIRRDVDINFPSGLKNKPEYRHQIVKYISAYDVGVSDWFDLPRHVESLLLRISKPPLNKQIGYLEPAIQEEID